MKQASRRGVLLANGSLPDPDYARSLLRDSDWIVAANGGTRLARALQRVPALLVGDTDSLLPELEKWLNDHQVPTLSFPRAKDETDLEIALWYLYEQGIRDVLLLGATGGRADHTVANFSVMAAATRRGMHVEAVAGQEHLFVVDEALELTVQVGDTLSLLPWGGDAEGVTTEGLRWKLEGATLPFGTTRGISNEAERETVRISLESGLLLVSHHR